MFGIVFFLLSLSAVYNASASELIMANQSDCDFETIRQVLKICWCQSKCLLGRGAYGRVYKGKWKKNSEANESVDVAVKAPKDKVQVEYEIDTLKKANHPNILKFYDQVKYGPDGGYVY